MDAPSLRFPEFSRSGPWKPLPFGELALLKNDKISPRTAPTSLPCIELEHLESDTGRILGSTKVTPSMAVKNRFEAGDVLFGKLRPNLRKYARPDFDGVCSQEIWVLSGLLADNGFLYQLVQTDRFSRLPWRPPAPGCQEPTGKLWKNPSFSFPPLKNSSIWPVFSPPPMRKLPPRGRWWRT